MRCKAIREIKAGETVLLSEGEWSDYEVKFLAKALKDFTMEELRSKYFEKYPEQIPYNRADLDKFSFYLVEAGFIEEVPCVELYLGTWGELKLELTREQG